MAVSRNVAALCGAAGVALVLPVGRCLWPKTNSDGPRAQRAPRTTCSAAFRSPTTIRPSRARVGATYGMFYAGAWAFEHRFRSPDNNIEVDYYAGITPTWGPVSFDFGYIYYNYPDDQTVDYLGAQGSRGHGTDAQADRRRHLLLSPGLRWSGLSTSTRERWPMSCPRRGSSRRPSGGLVGYTDFDSRARTTPTGTPASRWRSRI